MSSGSVSSLNAGESQVIQHNGEDYPDHTPMESSPRSPENVAMMSPQIYRSSTGSSAKFKDSVKKMFTRGHNISDDGMDNGDNSTGRRKRMLGLNALKKNIYQRPNYRIRIPGRRRSNDLSAGVDDYADGCNSDPEGFLNGFDGSDDDPDSGEGAMPYSGDQRKEQLENKIKELDEAIVQLEEENRGKCKEVEVHSPDSDEKPSNKPWKRPLAKRRSPSVDQLRKKRDSYTSQLEALKTPTSSQSRFMNNTRRQLGSGFKNLSHSLGLKKLPRFKRPKSVNDDVITKSASLEDVHPTSDMFSAVDEEVDMEALREEIFHLEHHSKELETRVEKNEMELGGLRQQVKDLLGSLNSEKQKTAHLEISFVEVMELKQHEVDNLQQQLTNIEKQSLERQQFLEEQLDEYQSKVEKMEVDFHTRLTQDQLSPTNVSSPLGRRVIIGCISSALFLVTTLLAVIGFVGDTLKWVRRQLVYQPKYIVIPSALLLLVTVGYVIFHPILLERGGSGYLFYFSV